MRTFLIKRNPEPDKKPSTINIVLQISEAERYTEHLESLEYKDLCPLEKKMMRSIDNHLWHYDNWITAKVPVTVCQVLTHE